MTERCKARITALAFAWMITKFFVLPAITWECDSKILKLLHLLQWYSANLQKIGQHFSKNVVSQFWKCWFLFVLYRHNTCGCKAISHSEEASKIKSHAKNNRLNLLLPFVAHSSVWLSLPSTLSKLWKKDVTRHSLAKHKHSLEMNLIVYYCHEHKFRLTEWLHGHQQTPINILLPQHFPELISRNLDICLLYINKVCKKILCILPGIFTNLF